MTRSLSLFMVAAIAVVAVRCGDRGAIGPDAADTGSTGLRRLVISAPPGSSGAVAAIGRATVDASSGDAIVYASLAPGSLPDARKIEISNRSFPAPALVVPVVDGGFDPVPVHASAGDTLDLIAWLSDGSRQSMLVKVQVRRPPGVVRSNPPRGRIDVALNVIITVVFSEPLDSKTVNTSSIQLRRDGKPVDGSVLFPGDSWEADFAPAKPLDPESTYEIVVTGEVRNLRGEALDAAFSSTFVTGSAACAGASSRSACPPGQVNENRVISGRVTERTPSGQRPVPNAKISAWVQLNDGTAYYDGTGYNVSLASDADGNYSVTSLPFARVQLYASVAGLDQPCGVVAWPSLAGTTADIELVAGGTRAFPSAGPGLWGFVGENGWINANPVAGARAIFEAREGVVAATATTDANGNFFLCRLPSFGKSFLNVSKSGYETVRNQLAFPSPGLYNIYLGLTPAP